MTKEINKKKTMSKVKSKKTTKKKTETKKEITTLKEVTIQKFKDLDGKFLLVKVGNEKRPATDDDILDIETKLTGLLNENNIKCLAFVTHHAIEIEVIEKLK